MRFSQTALLGVTMLLASAMLPASMLASQIQTFNVVGYPAQNPQVQGAFTVYDNNGLAGPFANGGLGAYGSPSIMTITSNGFLFDAFSIGVGGINSAIPAETETFIGDVYGGGTVTQTFQFPGNSQNFVTANLVGFDNLVDLRANLGFVTVQNLAYNPAPEPGTTGLFGLALVAVALACQRKFGNKAANRLRCLTKT